jgi:hypothetical protein
VRYCSCHKSSWKTSQRYKVKLNYDKLNLIFTCRTRVGKVFLGFLWSPFILRESETRPVSQTAQAPLHCDCASCVWHSSCCFVVSVCHKILWSSLRISTTLGCLHPNMFTFFLMLVCLHPNTFHYFCWLSHPTDFHLTNSFRHHWSVFIDTITQHHSYQSSLSFTPSISIHSNTTPFTPTPLRSLQHHSIHSYTTESVSNTSHQTLNKSISNTTQSQLQGSPTPHPTLQQHIATLQHKQLCVLAGT